MRYHLLPSALPGGSGSGPVFARAGVPADAEASPCSRRRGLSYIEVIIAVFVLAVGLLPAFSVFSRGNQGTMMTRDEILAQTYCSELIDYAQALGFDDLSPEAFDHREMDTIPGGSLIDGRFHRFLTVVDKVLAPGNADWPVGYRILQVEVTWTSSGVEQKFALTGLVFKGRTE